MEQMYVARILAGAEGVCQRTAFVLFKSFMAGDRLRLGKTKRPVLTGSQNRPSSFPGSARGKWENVYMEIRFEGNNKSYKVAML